MTKLQIITFPRSGHHWLMNMTQRALDLPCNWHCDLHNSQPHHETLVEKSHDFDLQFKTKPGVPIIVQWRNPVDALCSWYELGVRHGNWKSDKSHWRFWSAQHIIFAAQFYLKWIAPGVYPVIEYGSLRSNPAKYLEMIISNLEMEDRASTVKMDARPMRSVEDFDYYDPRFFETLESIFCELTA